MSERVPLNLILNGQEITVLAVLSDRQVKQLATALRGGLPPPPWFAGVAAAALEADGWVLQAADGSVCRTAEEMLRRMLPASGWHGRKGGA